MKELFHFVDWCHQLPEILAGSLGEGHVVFIVLFLDFFCWFATFRGLEETTPTSSSHLSEADSQAEKYTGPCFAIT